MRERLTCSIWSARWLAQCVLFDRARTHACLQMLSRATTQKNNASVIDDDEDGHIWPGDTDFLNASDRFDKFPSRHCNVVIFARCCTWASFQMSRSVEAYIRCCQDYTFSNTQGQLNILTGSLLENKEDEDPVIMRDEEQNLHESVTEDE